MITGQSGMPPLAAGVPMKGGYPAPNTLRLAVTRRTCFLRPFPMLPASIGGSDSRRASRPGRKTAGPAKKRDRPAEGVIVAETPGHGALSAAPARAASRRRIPNEARASGRSEIMPAPPFVGVDARGGPRFKREGRVARAPPLSLPWRPNSYRTHGDALP